MQIPLDRFEQVVDEKILERGLSYYRNGHVGEIEEIAPNTYEAIVEGTEDYTVELTIKNSVVTEHSCDCPYDMGPVCKHVTAVIFKLLEDELDLSETKTKKKKSSAKHKSTAEQINDILAKATHDELVKIISDEAKKNANFRNHLFTVLECYNDDISIEYYQKQVKSIIKAATGKYGFIEWNETRVVGRAIGEMLDGAQVNMDSKNYRTALMVLFAVIGEMEDALNNSDDSNGEIGGCIDESFEMLNNLAEVNRQEDIRKMIFETCLDFFKRNLYNGFDWHTELLEIAASQVKTDGEFKEVLALTEKPLESEYYEEVLQTIKYDLLLKVRGEIEANAFRDQNLSNSRFRRMAIEMAMEQKNFADAIRIARDGVKCDMQSKPGLAKEWYDWLLKIAQAQNDTPKIIEYARYLLIDNFRQEQDYYKILKKNVKHEEWDDFVCDIVAEIKNKGRYWDSELVAKIFISEKWWDKLLAFVKDCNRLSVTERYESFLAKQYAEEVAGIYAKQIMKFMENNMGRDNYKEACRYIRRMIKLGARAEADKIVATLRNLYPNRRALMEELNRV
ncbi:MAG: hypothetical protein IK025_02000 [Bacteroidales bacterium]|nr:hypothetical protein [Bacteroidales bacterium]